MTLSIGDERRGPSVDLRGDEAEDAVRELDLELEAEGALSGATAVGVRERGHERRAGSAGPRLSWAEGQPFVVRQHAGGDVPVPVAAETEGRRSWARGYALRVLAGDALCAALVMGAGVATLPLPFVVALPVVVGWVAAWVLALTLLRGYDVQRIGSGPEELQAVLRAAGALITTAAVVSYALHLEAPRRLVLVGLPLTAVLTAVARYVGRRRLHSARAHRQHGLRTLVVGDAGSVQDVARMLGEEPHHGYHVVGACLPRLGQRAGRTPVVGTLADIPQAVMDHRVDVVLVAGSELSGSSLRRLSWALEHTPAELVVSPGLVEVHGPRLAVRPTAGLSLLHLEVPSRRRGRQLGKEALDRVVGTLLFLAALPVIVTAAVAIRATSPGSPFFAQTRIGRDGVPFTMWKLRSMYVDAERRREDLLHQSDRDGLMFKMRSDPRITPVGRWLRRFSLDELPQLLNVVRGDMSMVGPRPPLPSEVEGYRDSVHRRLRVKPGLTGLWQVSGRADLSWEESVRLDLRYVDNWSASMDLLIIWKTARAVLHGSGAY